MNSAAVCTEKYSTKGNPLSALKAAGGRIVDSLRAKSGAIAAGLSLLTVASSGTALATETVLRDTIHDTPATTQNGKWVRCNQVPNPVPADMSGTTPVASGACLAITIPANSICTLKSLSYVFGVKSTTPMESPTDDQYDWRKLFNTNNGTRTTDVKLQVVDGPATNLVSRLEGDLYSRSVAESELETSMPWGSTTTAIISGVAVPYYRADLNFDGIADIVTGDSAKTIYVKVSSIAQQDKSTWMVWACSTLDAAGDDVRLSSGTKLNIPVAAYAAKVVADVRPKEVTQAPPTCGMEKIDGKMAVCWPASFGTNYSVGSSTNFTQWAPQEIEKIVTQNGKNYAVLVLDSTNTDGTITRPSSCFFILNPASKSKFLSVTKGNPLLALKAVGGRVADSLKTAARSVVSSNAGMLAGLSMLTAASGTALATETVIRDTIHDTPETTQNASWQRGNQTPATQTPTVATYAVHLVPNSVYTLSSFSFVFGCKSTVPIQSPTEDQYDWRQIFNTYNGERTTDLRVEVFDGPSTNLVHRMTGDIYSRSITQDEMGTTMPWGSTTDTYSARPVVPYNKAEITFPEIKPIETGEEGKTIYIKICFVKLQAKNTFGCLAVANGAPLDGDIALGSGEILGTPQSGYACKIVADVKPKEVVKPVPVCGLEMYNGKLSVCWSTSFGTNYNVISSTNLNQWTPQPLEGIITDTEKGKNYGVLVLDSTNVDGTITRPAACYFSLQSK